MDLVAGGGSKPLMRSQGDLSQPPVASTFPLVQPVVAYNNSPHTAGRREGGGV